MDKIEILSKMTLEEKASLCSGVGNWHTREIKRLGVPSIMMCDGPHGLRKQNGDGELKIHNSIPATCFPTASCIASSWDTTLAKRVGDAVGKEALSEKISIVLGPGVNIKRSPLCGRNFEYYSEDPLLAGHMAAEFIKGVEQNGVGTSLKHYCANNQETARLTVSADIDQRALHEIYLRPFELAVKLANPSTLMCSYNKINGIYGSENEFTLREVLRKKWCFKGFVMTDWGAANDRVLGVKNGLALEMPSSGGLNDANLANAVREGRLEEQYLDEAVLLLLDFIDAAQKVLSNTYFSDIDAHDQLARDAAKESAVLLKNNCFLPLSKTDRILVVGAMAKTPRYQGAGSSHITPHKITSFVDALDNEGIAYDFITGYGNTKAFDKKELKKCLAVAKSYKKILVFGGLPDSYEAEGFDRTSLSLPDNQNNLIAALAKENKNIAVVLSCGSGVTMPWLDDVAAVLLMYLAGQNCGGAAFDLLYCRAVPCGKLAETFALSLDSIPSSANFPANPSHCLYKESLFVGYRYFATAGEKVLFPFGFGLSYTEFVYSNFSIDKSLLGENDSLFVSFDVSNIGQYSAKEISQIYISKPASGVFRPRIELKAFTKTYIEAGTTKRVNIEIPYSALDYYNTAISDFCVEGGSYLIFVGTSSQNLLHSFNVEVLSKPMLMPPKKADWYFAPSPRPISDEEFFDLYGSSINYSYTPPKKGCFNTFNTFYDMCQVSLKARFIFKIVGFVVRAVSHSKKSDSGYLMLRETLRYTPLKNMVFTSQGVFTENMAEGVALILNGKNIKGLRKMNEKPKR